MGKIDQEMDANDEALASEDATVGSPIDPSAWRTARAIAYWAVVAGIVVASILLVSACNIVESASFKQQPKQLLVSARWEQ